MKAGQKRLPKTRKTSPHSDLYLGGYSYRKGFAPRLCAIILQMLEAIPAVKKKIGLDLCLAYLPLFSNERLPR